jgi:hypothetical protein
MKIKKIEHYKTTAVMVEFDEFFGEFDHARIDEIIDYMNSTDAGRVAYNIWKFKTEDSARNSLFILGLKT